jgi:aminopeptidase YwaD
MPFMPFILTGSRRLCTLLFLLAAIIPVTQVNGQSKKDRKVMAQLRTDITYLASDSLEGRRTGTEGERKAADYIESRYKDEEILPYKDHYRYPFNFVYGKQIADSTKITVNTVAIKMHEEIFPLPFSASAHVYGEIIPEVMEQGNIWMVPVYADRDEANNPHFDCEKSMYDRAKQMHKQGATAIIYYENYTGKWEPAFNKHSEYEPLELPVVFLKYEGYRKYIIEYDVNTPADINSDKRGLPIDITVSIKKAERTGNNIAAYIDNGAQYTVIVGAHYDHLGYGEDENSRLANAVKEHQVHHGADDNASGTAALLQVAKWIKSKKLRHYNYLFINFSGEELGLYGSKAFVRDQHIDSSRIAYMINMDMVGRLNDSTHALTVGGIGTSPKWADAVEMAGDDFKINIDSSGVGPSDHTTFYYAGIPVLFFFTGTHTDYHKPSDKAENINYAGEVLVLKYIEKVLAALDKENKKPKFTATKQSNVGKVNFKVTLGIMPDYTYETGGVRVDGVTESRPAFKAGIKAGDIITSLGDNKINGMQTYMEALSKFVPGDKTKVTILRDGKEMTFPIELSK